MSLPTSMLNREKCQNYNGTKQIPTITVIAVEFTVLFGPIFIISGTRTLPIISTIRQNVTTCCNREYTVDKKK